MNHTAKPVCCGFAAVLAVVFCPSTRIWAKQWILEPVTGKEIAIQPSSPDRQELDHAKELLVQAKLKDAHKLLRKWLKKFPHSSLRTEAMYYAAQSLERRDELYQAFEQYEELIDNHTDVDYFHKALQAEFGIAKRFLGGTKRKALGILRVSADGVGIKILQRIPDRWPGSTLAEQSLMSLADYYLAEGKFLDAVDYYDQLITIYPNSVSVRPARYLAAGAYLKMFKGARFDPAPLIEARERLIQYRELYGPDVHADDIQAMLQKIDALQAEREYEIAQFYQRTGKKKAARFHYRQLIQRWPESQWASKVQARLNKLGS